MAQQLRRGATAAGIGTYTRGLLDGLRRVAEEEGPDAVPDVLLHASRAPRGAETDPLAAWGWPVVTSALPGPALTRLWDRGFCPAPPGRAVVHATSLAFPPTPASALTVMVHDLAWREVPEAFPVRGRRWHEAALLRAFDHARALVTPSSATAAALLSGGAPTDRVRVIGHGADHLPPADVEGSRALLASHGVTGGYLLTVSTLEPRKNLKRLVAAYAAARPALAEPWPLVVVGPPGWGDALPAASVPHGVVPIGFVQGALLAGLYRGARCFAYIPITEGFGLPPLEAMRECVPVVASDCVPSTIGAALAVDPTDVTAIADALVAASSDDRRRSELVTAGLQHSDGLTWAASARSHVALWREFGG